ncbi:MAG TPA: patatin-like phospholipase family protein [Planctomycetaceae bacterium]
MRPQPITLVLGGGGARGLAHLGALEVLLVAGFTPRHIVGASIGSLVGALCALEPDVPRLQRKIIGYLGSPRFRDAWRFPPPPATVGDGDGSPETAACLAIEGPTPVSPDELLRGLIGDIVPDVDVESLPIPLSIVAADVTSRRPVVLDRGPLRTAVHASSAIPGCFAPVAWGGMRLCDSAVHDPLPMSIARSRTNYALVGVDVSRPGPPSEEGGSPDAAGGTDRTREPWTSVDIGPDAAVVIRPQVADTDWHDFSSPLPLIAAGRRAALEWLAA